jgi:hypothetical protein
VHTTDDDERIMVGGLVYNPCQYCCTMKGIVYSRARDGKSSFIVFFARQEI